MLPGYKVGGLRRKVSEVSVGLSKMLRFLASGIEKLHD